MPAPTPSMAYAELARLREKLKQQKHTFKQLSQELRQQQQFEQQFQAVQSYNRRVG